MIQTVEDHRSEERSALTRERERVAEFRAVLDEKRRAIEGIARAWQSDPQTGPGATRVC